MHLIIDGYVANCEKLQDEKFILHILETYPEKIGMVKISSPYVLRYMGKNPKEWGLSGFVLIAESHISIHTFPEYSFVNIDVFSCKDFEPERVVEDIKNYFELKEMRTYIIDRGLDVYEGIGEIKAGKEK